MCKIFSLVTSFWWEREKIFYIYSGPKPSFVRSPWKGLKSIFLKSVYKWMSLYKCPLYDHSWPFYCHMYDHLSQNWGSDDHFEVLNRSYLWLVEKLWHKTQIFPFLFFCDFVQKQTFASFLFFTFLCFLS